MSDPGGKRGRRRWVLLASVLLASVLLVGAGVVAGALNSTGPARSGKPAAAPSATAVDLARLPVERRPFCDDLDVEDVQEALGAPVARSSRYGPGQRVLLAPGVHDVSHEYACAFRGGAAQARVWLFAEPVSRPVAGRLVRETATERGCRPAAVRTDFGDPSAVTVCPGPDRASREVVLRGLFGDAWLSCALTTAVRADEATARADRWCTQVVRRLGGAD